MNAKPVQLDQVPEKYDPVAIQRVLESAVRRITDVGDGKASVELVPPAKQATDEALEWIL